MQPLVGVAKKGVPLVFSGRGSEPTSPALCYDGVQQNGKDQVQGKLFSPPSLFAAS